VTITIDPTYPVVGDTITITQTYTVTDEDDAEDEFQTTPEVEQPIITLTATPTESDLETGILYDAAGAFTSEFEPDVEGEYDFTAARRVDYRAAPSFDGDPSGSDYSIVTTVETFSIRVGVSMDLPIVTTTGHDVTLRVKSHNGVVTDAELVDPTTSVALAATQDSTVTTKLAALETVATSSLGPDIAAKVDELITKYEAHRIQGTIHNGADDTVNAFVFDRPYSNLSAIERLNLLRVVFVRHLTGASNATLTWHAADDTKNTPIVGEASDQASSIVLYSDLYRCYEAHRTQTSAPASHTSSDATNTLASASVLVDLIKTYLAYVASASPTAPTNFEPGYLNLRSLYGFTKTPS
jgi:hypothetical protein